MADYLHSGANKMNKVEAYKNENKLLLADKLGHAKVSSLKEQNLLNTIATVQQHSNKITQLEADANKVRGAYVYKGTVETEFDLPLNDNSVGDVYNTSSTGMNYAWNGESWDELGETSRSNTGDNWSFNSIPIYTETLSQEWYYDDEEVNVYQIPTSIFGNGLSAILVTIKNISTTNDLSFVINNFYFHTDVEGTTFSFLYFPFHGIGLGISFNEDLQGNALYPARMNTKIFLPINGNVPLITSIGITHSSLPVGTTITVYAPTI